MLAALLVGVVAAALAITGPARANPPPATDSGAVLADTSTSYSVTLVTGDRVRVAGDGQVVVQRGEGRDGVSFVTRRSGESIYVIPSDAVGLLAEDRLDLQLFDVALLREFGYDQRGDLPLIVTHDGAADAAGSTVAAQGAEVVGDLPAIDGMAVRVDEASAVGFWEGLTDGPEDARTMAGAVSTVWLDGKVELLLDESVPQVGAPAAWDLGWDGAGVTVAVLDTGIDANHPDLADQLVGQRNFTEGEEDDRDLYGHGTHVGSIVAGTGAASDGRYEGVAPGAQLLDGKVCTVDDCLTSWVLAGMQWAAEQGAAVVNMSLGWPDNPPLEQAVETLTDEYGVLFVVSAGNSGTDASVGSPAKADSALAVGAVERDDSLAYFSSRGPRPDGALKPDITAPGVEIVAANSQDGIILDAPGDYVAASGTSMSAPHVAGAAAILAQQHPDWSPAQLKAALMASAAPNPEIGVFGQGAGRLDVARAVTQTVTASPPSVSFQRLPWPHDDDEPQTRTITYHNDGDADVTLELAPAASGPDGEPAPDGFFTLDATNVTVPAGGSAEVSLTTDTSVGDVDGYFGGHLTASGPDGVVVTTAFAVDREVESYDVTLVHTDRDGAPAADSYLTYLTSYTDDRWFFAIGEPETTIRVPAGDYVVESYFFAEVDDALSMSMLLLPRLEITDDQTMVLDAREAEPVTLAVDDPAATLVWQGVVFTLVTEGIFLGAGLSIPGGEVHTAQLGPDDAVDGLNTVVAGELAAPARNGNIAGSAATYHLARLVESRFPTGFEATVTRRELAAVRAAHAAQAPGSEGFKAVIALWPGVEAFTPGEFSPIELPVARTEYRDTGGGVEWVSLFDEVHDGELVVILDGAPTGYQAGRTYHERWNYAVFGPVLASELSGVLRLGNELAVQPDLYGDGAGHWGWSPSTMNIRVYRAGELIVDEPSDFALVEVPPEPAGYRVEVEAERDAPAPLSSQTSLVWEFESSYVDDETVMQLPVSVVRFSPPLAPDNTTAAGRPLLVPVSVDPAPASDAGRVTSLSVEVSFDDGESWEDARVIGRHVLVRHPRGSGFVSLRATAADAEGQSVEQTIIRAYRIR